MKKTFRIHGIHTFKLHTKKCYSLRGEGAFLDWYEIEKVIKNSKVFEQKGDLLNFKANIDPMAVLSQVKPG